MALSPSAPSMHTQRQSACAQQGVRKPSCAPQVPPFSSEVTKQDQERWQEPSWPTPPGLPASGCPVPVPAVSLSLPASAWLVPPCACQTRDAVATPVQGLGRPPAGSLSLEDRLLTEHERARVQCQCQCQCQCSVVWGGVLCCAVLCCASVV